jgi:CheY-like chemotaxis protein
MGGELSVSSVPEQGSLFTVQLRVADESERSSGSARAPSTPGRGLREAPRVLVIDDDQLVAKGVARALTGHQVTLAKSGQDGLDRLLSGEAFDVVLCDLMMPDVTGMKIHRFLKERRPGLEKKMIFLTGGAVTDSASQFLAQIETPWLKKPFRPDVLRAITERHARLAAK